MTKSDLRTGMIITYREGRRGMVYLNVYPAMMNNSNDIIVDEGNGWMRLADYNEDLTCKNYDKYDIVKIESAPNALWFPTPFDKEMKTKVLWERTKKMTISEIEDILGYKIEIINDK